MRNPYIPHKTDRELRKYGYIPDADIRSMIREIEAVKVQLGLGRAWAGGLFGQRLRLSRRA